MSCVRCDGPPLNPDVAELLQRIASGNHACEICPSMVRAAIRVKHAAEINNAVITIYTTMDGAPPELLGEIEQHYLDAAALVGTARRAREAVLSKEAVDGHRS
jgi:hypothetical protein